MAAATLSSVVTRTRPLQNVTALAARFENFVSARRLKRNLRPLGPAPAKSAPPYPPPRTPTLSGRWWRHVTWRWAPGDTSTARGDTCPTYPVNAYRVPHTPAPTCHLYPTTL